jgi:hypothetical protein
MDAVEVRRAFVAFAGEDRFRAFVRALNTAPLSLMRLRFWQAELWAAFVQADPRWPADFVGVREAFRVCEVHGSELARDAVPAPAGQIQWRYTQSPDSGSPHSPHFPPAFAAFPYPGWGVDPAAWSGCGTRLMEVWYCRECRRLRAAWEAEHGPEAKEDAARFGI